MTDPATEGEARKAALKKMINRLHGGASPEEVKAEFRALLEDVEADEISRVEEELIRDGMPAEEIHRLCDVHLAAFRESLEAQAPIAPPGHPIRILMEEHKALLGFADQLRCAAGEVGGAEGYEAAAGLLDGLCSLVDHFRGSESHYLREENVLFPYLERHGVTQPPAIMSMEHDQIREIEKGLYRLIETRQDTAFPDFASQLKERAIALAEMLGSHFYKENNILFPTALKVVEEPEWAEARRQFDELGYCCFTPEIGGVVALEPSPRTPSASGGGRIEFETGSLTPRQLEAILDSLPVDITFVDARDTVRYFNQARDRIFPRTKAVIGREIRQCHPQKSLHKVNEILEGFKAGSRDSATFWIRMDGRLIYIQYFPVTGPSDEYLGCLEVTQDIAGLQEVEGEKRLL